MSGQAGGRRRPLVAANWKMNLLRADAESFCGGLRAAGAPDSDVVIFPSFPLLTTVGDGLAGTSIAWGGQDLHPAAKGAHTGDVSGPQLVDSGCRYVLCGHSERRSDHHEDDTLVGRKAKAAREHGLIPLICVGETREERAAGETAAVLRRQLKAALESEPSSFELAYEPVWAIGTGETATPELAQKAHAFLREGLEKLVGASLAASTRILYGGSAKPENVADLIVQPDIDGFLIGGASLDVTKFLAIIAACDSHHGAEFAP